MKYPQTMFCSVLVAGLAGCGTAAGLSSKDDQRDQVRGT